jgi:hypothetical protein
VHRFRRKKEPVLVSIYFFCALSMSGKVDMRHTERGTGVEETGEGDFFFFEERAGAGGVEKSGDKEQ